VPRLVLDTNIYISAYGFGGAPAELMRACIVGEHAIVTSPAILTEVADKLYEVLEFDDAHVSGVIRQVARLAEIVRPNMRIDVLHDEPDNRVLECAIQAAADLIVSGDRHLLGLRSYEGIPVVRVRDVLDRF
jgi:conserved hypothetical protein TIGR00305